MLLFNSGVFPDRTLKINRSSAVAGHEIDGCIEDQLQFRKRDKPPSWGARIYGAGGDTCPRTLHSMFLALEQGLGERTSFLIKR
jgi:hypothetical protein